MDELINRARERRIITIPASLVALASGGMGLYTNAAGAPPFDWMQGVISACLIVVSAVLFAFIVRSNGGAKK